jgi:DNA invertase Pin-like site-specific DNA recombinase
MMGFLREGDILVVESISRLARSTRDLLDIVDQLDKKKVGFISQKESIDTSTPQGRFVLTIFSALAQLERETLLQRQREGLQAAKAKGKQLGRPVLEKPVEWEAVVSQYRAGKISCTQAHRKLRIGKTTFFKWIKN